MEVAGIYSKVTGLYFPPLLNNLNVYVYNLTSLKSNVLHFRFNRQKFDNNQEEIIF